MMGQEVAGYRPPVHRDTRPAPRPVSHAAPSHSAALNLRPRGAQPVRHDTDARRADALVKLIIRQHAQKRVREQGPRNFVKQMLRHPSVALSGPLGDSYQSDYQNPQRYEALQRAAQQAQGGGSFFDVPDFMSMDNLEAGLPDMPDMPSVNPWTYASPHIPKMPWRQNYSRQKAIQNGGDPFKGGFIPGGG